MAKVILLSLLLICSPAWADYIFIEGGARNGDGCRLFMLTSLYEKYPWKIYAIEANPEKRVELSELAINRGIIYIDKAMWTHDDGVNFYIDEVADEHSGLFGKNRQIEADLEGYKVYVKPKKITVPSFSFSEWLKKFKEEDFIVLCMDIEGAEYDIIVDMLKTGTIKLIDVLFVEFHWWLTFEGAKDELLIRTRDLGVIVDELSLDGEGVDLITSLGEYMDDNK